MSASCDRSTWKVRSPAPLAENATPSRAAVMATLAQLPHALPWPLLHMGCMGDVDALALRLLETLSVPWYGKLARVRRGPGGTTPV